LSILKFRDEQKAVALVRDSEFGFAGRVFSTDFPGRSERRGSA
jgi:acyl-CoA reductase-like NAD-dependent aldehyde dehydrogenase